MENYYRQMKIKPYPTSSKSERALVVSGLWLRAGFIGASALMAGLMMLFTGESQPALALALAVGGGIFALHAWRRSRAVLERVDSSTASLSVSAPRRDNDHGLGSAVLR
jgi:4-hydroxybenzoate polyprenyltransferase